jgi:hypothetical protein
MARELPKDEGPAVKGLVGVKDKKNKGKSQPLVDNVNRVTSNMPFSPAIGRAPTMQELGLVSTKATKDKAYKDALASMQSGSGGGGPSGPSPLDRYTRAIQGMLTSGSYRQPQDDLLAKLTEMYGQAQPQINTAMDSLTGFLQGQSNPYAGLQAQTTQATPQLSELLQSQGVDQTPLQQLAAVTQAQNTGQSTAFQNLIGSMQNMWQGNQAGQISDVAAQRAGLQTQLENSRLGAGTQLNTQAAGQQQDLMKMLLEALSKGGRPNKGGLFGESNTAARLPFNVGRRGQ